MFWGAYGQVRETEFPFMLERDGNMPPMPTSTGQNAIVAFISNANVDGTSLRLAREPDARFILDLRLQPELNQHLSQVNNDVVAQRKWLREYVNREVAGEEYYFIISLDSRDVGTVRIYEVCEDSFRWGSWIISRGTSPRVSLASVKLIYSIGFEVLGIKQAYLEVRKDNISVNRFHRRMGAELISEDDNTFYYQIDESAVQAYFDRRLKS